MKSNINKPRLFISKCRFVFLILPILSAFAFPPVTHALPSLTLNTTGQPPLNTVAHDGFMDEVTREAMKRIGFRLDITRLPAERALRHANEGLIDGEMSRIKGIDKTYPNLVRVSEKIMVWEFCVFSGKPINLQKGWDSLTNKNVAFITGWKILENSVPTSSTTTKTRDSQQLFTLLKNNRTDYIIYERWGGNYILNKFQLANVKLRNPPLASREMFIYLHKKHSALAPQLAQALAEMKRDGVYDSLVKKHLFTFINNR